MPLLIFVFQIDTSWTTRNSLCKHVRKEWPADSPHHMRSWNLQRMPGLLSLDTRPCWMSKAMLRPRLGEAYHMSNHPGVFQSLLIANFGMHIVWLSCANNPSLQLLNSAPCRRARLHSPDKPSPIRCFFQLLWLVPLRATSVSTGNNQGSYGICSLQIPCCKAIHEWIWYPHTCARWRATLRPSASASAFGSDFWTICAFRCVSGGDFFCKFDDEEVRSWLLTVADIT